MTSTPVLYIEDEEDYQMLVQRILGRAGWKVFTADSGEEGLQLLEDIRPNLLILDINLPDADGYAICAQLRKTKAWMNLPILMLTVRRRPDEWLKGFSVGADDYVAKPLNPPELIQRVRTCLLSKPTRALLEGTPEYQLIQAALGGNRAAFEVLILQYRERLLANLLPLTRNSWEAEDVASQAFVMAYQQLVTFRGGSSFYTWLYRIAVNVFHRSLRESPTTSLDSLPQVQDRGIPPRHNEWDPIVTELTRDAEERKAHALVTQLPQPYRGILEHHVLEGMSYKRIASRLKIPTGTVMSRLFKAKALLRKAWEES